MRLNFGSTPSGVYVPGHCEHLIGEYRSPGEVVLGKARHDIRDFFKSYHFVRKIESAWRDFQNGTVELAWTGSRYGRNRAGEGADSEVYSSPWQSPKHGLLFSRSCKGFLLVQMKMRWQQLTKTAKKVERPIAKSRRWHRTDSRKPILLRSVLREWGSDLD